MTFDRCTLVLISLPLSIGCVPSICTRRTTVPLHLFASRRSFCRCLSRALTVFSPCPPLRRCLLCSNDSRVKDWYSNIQNLPKSRLLFNIRDHLLFNTGFAFFVSLVHYLSPQHVIDDLHVRSLPQCVFICFAVRSVRVFGLMLKRVALVPCHSRSMFEVLRLKTRFVFARTMQTSGSRPVRHCTATSYSRLVRACLICGVLLTTARNKKLLVH